MTNRRAMAAFTATSWTSDRDARAGPLWSGNVVPSYVARSVDHTQVRLFDPGTTVNPRADITLANLPATRAASVVFVNAGAPAGPTSFMVTPCP